MIKNGFSTSLPTSTAAVGVLMGAVRGRGLSAASVDVPNLMVVVD
jgi:hypothetical protein